MSKKRLSLQSILEEEREQASDVQSSSPSTQKVKEEDPASSREDKSDFIRLSITISPEDFERLQTESMLRRRERSTYTFSHLARIALAEWLDKVEKKRSKGSR